MYSIELSENSRANLLRNAEMKVEGANAKIIIGNKGVQMPWSCRKWNRRELEFPVVPL